jgi:hypothetical protein
MAAPPGAAHFQKLDIDIRQLALAHGAGRDR